MFHFLRADPWGAHRHVRSLACAVLLCLVVTSPALPQAATPQTVAPPANPAQPAQQPQPPTQPEQSPAASGPGLIDKLGDAIKGSIDSVTSNLKGTQQTIQDLNKGTIDTLTRLPVTGVATGRAICGRADNGAPDCRFASDKLCQDKGYKTGRGVDIETAENCNPRVYLPGYQRKDGDCRIDNYVTRATCN